MSIKILESEKRKAENRFIDILWIIERRSGICIFEKKYNDINNTHHSVDLICGFLSAISMLASEVFSEDIHYIKLSNSKLYFKYTDYLLFILSDNDKKYFSSHKIKLILTEIANKFLILYDKDFLNWDRDINKFKPFAFYLDNFI